MNKEEFKALDEITRTAALIERGVLIGKREFISHLVYLYQVDGFYVEVIYSDKLKRVVRINPFENIELLQPYLEKIDITELQQILSNGL